MWYELPCGDSKEEAKCSQAMTRYRGGPIRIVGANLRSKEEVAQEMEMPKFGNLRVLMKYKERIHVRNVIGIASYNKENFNCTIK